MNDAPRSNSFVRSNQFIAVLVAGFFTAWLIACGNYSKPSVAANRFAIEVQPIALDPDDPKRVEFDRLRLLGAFQLHGNSFRFGGFSGLSIGADGRLYAVSDRGFWLSARAHLHPGGRLLNLTDSQIRPILTPSGARVEKLFTDAEALARAPDGSFIVGFEHVHRLWRYAAPPETLSSSATPVPLPAEVSKARANGGLEAVSVRPDGKIFAIAEGLENPDGSFKAWLIDGEQSEQLSYTASAGFRASDAVALGNGDVLVLERQHQLPVRFSARLTRVKARDIKAGAKLEGEEILRLEPPLKTDNFEGVAVMETRDGTMIFLVSDDNYFFFQRTLLLQFLLPEPPKNSD